MTCPKLPQRSNRHVNGIFLFLESEPHILAKRNAEIVLQYSTAYPFRLRGNILLCVFCNEEFENPTDFRTHVNSNHKVFTVSSLYTYIGRRKEYIKVDCTDLACRQCAKPFPTIGNVAEHLVKEHQHEINFDNEIGLQSYKLEKGKWNCVLCDEKSQSVTKLVRHMAASHYQKFKCDTCSRTYTTAEALKFHTKCCHSGKFLCRKCWKDFPTVEERNEHKKNTQSCWQHGCGYCSERFQSYEAKNKHLAEKHNRPERRYSCSHCDSTFPGRKSLNSHYRKMHTGEGFNCSTCGMKFWALVQLRDHSLIHTGIKAHKCSVCSKAFLKKFNLTQHMWIHTDDKRFECIPCNRDFNQKISYKTHMKLYHSRPTYTVV